MEIIINGRVSADPRDRVLAIEAATNAICESVGQDPAEGTMMLLTAAVHIAMQHSDKPLCTILRKALSLRGSAEACSDELRFSDDPKLMDDGNPQRKGGKTRAERLTSEERREIARQGGLARSARYQAPDPDAIPWAVAEGTLTIGDARIPCAVLDNGKRVLSQQGVLLALGRARSAAGGEGASVDEGAAFLRAKNLKPFISRELELSTKACMYKPRLGGYTPRKGWLAIAMMDSAMEDIDAG